MIYITGDTHGSFKRINSRNIPTWTSMTRDDYLIICGDFGGVWDTIVSDEEHRNILELTRCPFTILFIDGNHENFDRLERYPVVEFRGGKAHKIKSNIYHLMRGEYYEIDGKTFWVFGGARSHDISDGILDESDFSSYRSFLKKVRQMEDENKMFRINHLSWWKEELPTQQEMNFGLQTLLENNNSVDYVITHCCPQSIASICGFREPDILTKYFNDIDRKIEFKKWFFGHYHNDIQILDKYVMLYHQIERIL